MQTTFKIDDMTVTPAKMIEDGRAFVGQRVFARTKAQNALDVPAGHVGIVKGITPWYFDVDFPGHNSGLDSRSGRYLVNPDEIAFETRGYRTLRDLRFAFPVGSFVKVRSGGTGYPFAPAGTVGRVTGHYVGSVKSKGGLIQVRFAGDQDIVDGGGLASGDDGWNCFVEELETWNPRSFAPQTRKVLELLRTGPQTGVTAAAVLKVRSMTKRVSELRDAGVGIQAVWKRDATGQRYTQYTLTADPYASYEELHRAGL